MTDAKMTLNPKLVWERYVVPFKMKSGATDEEKAWPEYITFDPNINREDESFFMLDGKASHGGNIRTTYELVWSVLQPAVFMRVAHVRFKGRRDFNAIRYTIGEIEIELEINGSIVLASGQTQRGNIEHVHMPIISEPYMRH
jgi:hypothetical protein